MQTYQPWTAAALYGGVTPPQPDGAPGPTPGAETAIRTTARDSQDGRGDPIAWFVLIIAAAVAFGFLSVRVSVGR